MPAHSHLQLFKFLPSKCAPSCPRRAMLLEAALLLQAGDCESTERAFQLAEITNGPLQIRTEPPERFSTTKGPMPPLLASSLTFASLFPRRRPFKAATAHDGDVEDDEDSLAIAMATSCYLRQPRKSAQSHKLEKSIESPRLRPAVLLDLLHRAVETPELARSFLNSESQLFLIHRNDSQNLQDASFGANGRRNPSSFPFSLSLTARCIAWGSPSAHANELKQLVCTFGAWLFSDSNNNNNHIPLFRTFPDTIYRSFSPWLLISHLNSRNTRTDVGIHQIREAIRDENSSLWWVGRREERIKNPEAHRLCHRRWKVQHAGDHFGRCRKPSYPQTTWGRIMSQACCSGVTSVQLARKIFPSEF